ncbi:MAG: phenylacetate--CoA ligase [Acidimicrobiia bacterium]|nr:MAG: phenylacetate--CoA ligase [Acidimicrobiia bacterium]
MIEELVPRLTPEERDEKLRRQIAYDLTSPFYRERFEEHSIDPSTIRTLEDVRTLPIFITPDVHRQEQERTLVEEGHPFGRFLCAPPDRIVAVNSTSGTTGVPTFYAFTQKDVAATDRLWARACRFVGVRPGDRVMIGYGLSMYLAGVPLIRALERMGACPIPVGAEVGAEKLIRMMALLRPRVLACTPSYAEHLLERVPEVLGHEAAGLGVEILICAGEPGAGLPEVRSKLTAGWGAKVFDMLGGAHGIMMASCHAAEYQGMHVLGDDYSISTDLVEPDSDQPIDIVDGAIGERVKTAIDWEAQPPLRYSVGDVYQVFTETCPCGVPGTRIKVLGRVDDLLIVKGTKLYPAAIKNLINSFVPRLTGEFRIVLDGPPPRVKPPLRLRVEAAPGAGPEVVEQLAAEVAETMHRRFAVRPQVEMVAAGTLPRSTHKQKLIEIIDEKEGTSL